MVSTIPVAHKPNLVVYLYLRDQGFHFAAKRSLVGFANIAVLPKDMVKAAADRVFIYIQRDIDTDIALLSNGFPCALEATGTSAWLGSAKSDSWT